MIPPRTYEVWAPEHGGERATCGTVEEHTMRDAATEYAERKHADFDYFDEIAVCVAEEGSVEVYTFTVRAEQSMTFRAVECHVSVTP